MQEKDEKKIGKTEEEIRAEIKKLADEANATSSLQLNLLSDINITDEDLDEAFESQILASSANPEESHRLYYGIRNMLMNNLPKGKENKKFRQFVYDEKNLFLNRGEAIKANGLRGSDGRMTYINDFLTEAFSVVSMWVVDGANYYDIFLKFREMNIERGFYRP